MRLRRALTLGVAAAALASSAAAGAHAGVGAAVEPDGSTAVDPGAPGDQQPSCGDRDAAEFPIATRLRGGPAAYRPGGATADWSVELTNTTDETCHNIHPVIVLVERGRGEKAALRADDVKLEFDDGTGRWITVPLDTTEEDEYIGVLAGDFPKFPGFTVAGDRTLTVKVRLAFDSGTAPIRAVANAAVVQRQADDGEWVGESNDYRFAVADGEGDGDVEPDADVDVDPDVDPPDPDVDAPGVEAEADADADAGTSAGVDAGGRGDTGTTAPGTDGHHRGGLGEPPALAATGPDSRAYALAAAGALLLSGAALVTGVRRRERGRAPMG